MQARKEKRLILIFSQFVREHEKATGAKVFRFENLTDWLGLRYSNLNWKQVRWMMERDWVEDLGGNDYFYNKDVSLPYLEEIIAEADPDATVTFHKSAAVGPSVPLKQKDT